jgi:predicted  nucleic acid-binding Zn-ribbon protein
MVFGFGKKKSQENAASTSQQEKVILLQDVSTFLKEFESPRLSKIIQEAKRIKNEIEVDRKNINNTILEFEADDLNLDDVDKNLKTVVKRGKDTVVSTIKKETTSKLSNLEKYDDVLMYNIEVSQILKRMGDVLGVHTRAMHVFARKYAEKLKEEIARMAQNRNLLQNLINEQESFKTHSESIIELIKKIEILSLEYSQKNKRLTEVITEIEWTKQNIKTYEHDIAELRSKKEYQEFLEIKKKIDLLSHERNEIKSKIDTQFLKISRPLSKYTYVSSLEKPLKKMMEELGSNPYQVILPQNKSAIIEILVATSKSVLAGNVSVKDADKAVQQIKETIDMLDEFLMLKEAYANKLSGLESNLRVFDVILLESKEKDLQKARSNLLDLESTSKKVEKEIEENRTQINTTKSDVEASLSRLSKIKMTIKF